MRQSRILVIALASLVVGLGLAPPAHAARPFGIAANWLRVEWAEAPGPVEGYAIFVRRDGGESRLEQHVVAPSAVLVGAFGQTLEIQVAAFDADGSLGPSSPPSAPFVLLRPSEDTDGDGWANREDTCPLTGDFFQRDGDLDSVGDACDACVLVADADQGDVDGDGIGDACECGDASGDGRVDTRDARLVQLCSVGQIADPEICGVPCDVTGDDRCDTSDARVIGLLAAGIVAKDDLACSLRP